MYLYVSETFGCIKLVLVFCGTERGSLEFGAQNFASGVLRRRAVVRRPGDANLHFGGLGAPKYISCIFAMHKCRSGVLGARVYVGHCWSAEMYFGEFGAQGCISGIWGRGYVFLEFGVAWMHISAMPVGEEVSLAAIRPWAHLAVLPN